MSQELITALAIATSILARDKYLGHTDVSEYRDLGFMFVSLCCIPIPDSRSHPLEAIEC